MDVGIFGSLEVGVKEYWLILEAFYLRGGSVGN